MLELSVFRMLFVVTSPCSSPILFRARKEDGGVLPASTSALSISGHLDFKVAMVRLALVCLPIIRCGTGLGTPELIGD